MQQEPTLSHASTTTNTEGGAAIGGDAHAGHDFIGRDQINITIHSAPAHPTPLPASELHLINFSYPITFAQQQEIEAAVGYRLARIIDLMVEFEETQSFGAQCVKLVDRVPLSPDQWRHLPLLINPPGYAPAAVCLLGELHGRIHHFPSVLRFRPDNTGPVRRFVLEEIINLQALRDAARKRG